jgi:DNA-binding transcriptional MerR regulator
LLKIGEFSRISQVSIKTLRLYDELGLLVPAQVDPFTAYRYYTVNQLARLNRILAYKDLGFSLEEVTTLLEGNLTPEMIRSLLDTKKKELHGRIAEEQKRLQRVETRLALIEQENHMPEYEVVLKEIPLQKVAVVKGVIPNYDESGPIFDHLFEELFNTIHQQRTRYSGCGLAIYYDAQADDQGIPVEAAVIIDEPMIESNRVKVHDLPEARPIASVVHHGVFDTISQAYESLLRWIEANGYHITGPCREHYLNFDRKDMRNNVTEIQYPVEKN